MNKFEVFFMPTDLKVYENAPLKLSQKFNKCFEILEINSFFDPLNIRF